MIHPPTFLPISSRLPLSIFACALALSMAACTDNTPGGVEPTTIPPNATTGPGNAFAAPGSADGSVGTADTGFPSNGGGNGPNAPGH